MTPHELAASGTEHAHQRAVMAWANCAALYGIAWADQPEAYDYRTRDALRSTHGNSYTIPALKKLFAIHNQGHGDAIRGNRAKAEGVKSGVPDMMLPLVVDHWAGLFIELKRKRKEDTSTDQEEWITYLNEAGYAAKVAVGWLEAVDVLKWYVWPIVPSGR
jgi:hypothetical protein